MELILTRQGLELIRNIIFGRHSFLRFVPTRQLVTRHDIFVFIGLLDPVFRMLGTRAPPCETIQPGRTLGEKDNVGYQYANEDITYHAVAPQMKTAF
jgi:hypothetical protein